MLYALQAPSGYFVVLELYDVGYVYTDKLSEATALECWQWQETYSDIPGNLVPYHEE